MLIKNAKTNLNVLKHAIGNTKEGLLGLTLAAILISYAIIPDNATTGIKKQNVDCSGLIAVGLIVKSS